MDYDGKRELDEGQLKDAAGGIVGSPSEHCFFEPEVPYKKRWYGDECYIACKKACSAIEYCKCHGTVRCIERYHKMHRPLNDSAGPVYPFPEGSFNHNQGSKLVQENPWANK